MNVWAALIRRDLAREWSSGSWWLPVAFFLLVATLYPFAVGPDSALLARTGAGVLWIAALLAALLPIERLFAPDSASGTLDQLALRGISDEGVAAAKALAHMVGFGVPLLLSTLPAAALLGLSGETLARLAIGLAIGIPGLASLSVTIAAVTLGQQRSGALGGLLMLPLAVPILIFGAGSIQPIGNSAMLFLGAASLLLVAITPFAAGAALRAAREV
ncbi:MAG: heme exporter protein CcmB [Pseudomonadota bacterium]